MLTLRIPGLFLASEANTHDHWKGRQGRTKDVRAVVGLHLNLRRPPPLPVRVCITRVAPRSLDDDNLARACKGARDAIAAWFGVDDRDPRVEWRVDQRSDGPKTRAVEIRVRSLGASRAEQAGIDDRVLLALTPADAESLSAALVRVNIGERAVVVVGDVTVVMENAR